MEESQYFGHEHPLQLLLNEEQMMMSSNQSGVSDCSRCGEKVSAPIFSCVECGFYLHKQCAEAPSEINHPFHPDHPLILLQNPPYSCTCDFCDETCQRFVYHCSCGLGFHIKCALFTFNIAQSNLKHQLLEHVPHQDPSIISSENIGKQLEDIFTLCFACQEPLVYYAYFPLDCGFNLHKKCADLPLVNIEMGHKHSLDLQFNSKRLSCEICQATRRRGLVYCCPPCNSVFDIECVLLPPNVEVKSHQHPLVLLNEGNISNQSGLAQYCLRCGEKVSAPSFSCVECGFYLHKKCAEAPLEINHPFHPDHPLLLQKISPYSTGYVCHFCDQPCQRFVYHCSCGLFCHIKCALFTYDIAEKKLKELEHVAVEDPSIISSENINGEKLEDLPKCFACWEPLANYTYFSLDCGFHLHKKCADLPLQVTDMCHKHPLALRFHNEQLFCKICQGKIKPAGFIYCCSPCNFALHIECLLLPLNIEVKSHQFTLFGRRVPFICDACGNEGNFVAYICCASNIIVHKRCISLPRVIKSNWHDRHFIVHKYFLEEEEEPKSCDCLSCHKEVNVKHGSYYCSDCNIVFHVNCVTGEESSYSVVSLENEDEKSSDSLKRSSITCVFERNDAGEATKIKHFKHIHNLLLSDKIVEHDQSCDGCMLPIWNSFYYCSELECDFLLHKACAELPKAKHVWHHDCRKPLILTSYEPFICELCDYPSNGFSYKCNACGEQICLRCVIALTPGAHKCEGHEHHLLYYKDYEGQCSACGDVTKGAFRCKDCDFVLDHICFSLPTRAGHKCDEHLLALTYHDGYNYSECHYCDICEEQRDPNHWFYRCASTCDTSAHIDCALGRFPFVKLGRVYENNKVHPHPLTVVKKMYYYPDCNSCGKPCQDLALECGESGCNYILHVECLKHLRLNRRMDWRCCS